ncbi:hypothetical protein LOTGIDRAFT_239604 [Lottia gigantea]|uniref:MAM domain-containing protein n=1 Tax=Lottia gigantea TaxID=225164 RepID=V4ABQ3_LOTGI|nr:hypothetical protein LOTGIDRAFT_239604 [Lottia gigantea]ESO90746.1 hypothetical protein LOTGIDRAFT_239604 [Lottia gigantea]
MMRTLILFCCIAVVYSEMVAKGYPEPISYICDFSENLCNFHGNSTLMEWKIVNSTTGDLNRFLQTNATDTLDQNKYVLSRCYTVTSPKLCLSFRYKLTGSDVTKLFVKQKGGDKYQTWESKKEMVNQGWTEININVSLLPLQKEVQFLFKAILGGVSGNTVGIDDVILAPYEC